MLPVDLKLPSTFTSYRKGQLETSIALASSPKRFRLLSAPPGRGKSLINMTVARLREDDGRTIILTGTKSLQSQMVADFNESGLAEVKGLSNYRCVAADRHLSGFSPSGSTCDLGPCRAGVFCNYREEGGCLYYDAQAQAQMASIVVTNYAYWMALGRSGETQHLLGEFNTIILDECLPPGTLIGGVRIEDIRCGDYVPSFNEKTGQVTNGLVVGRTVNIVSGLLRLSYRGTSLVCTPSHPVWTTEGWVRAGNLSVGDTVLCSPRHDRRPDDATKRSDSVRTASGCGVHDLSEHDSLFSPEGRREDVQTESDGQGLLLPSMLPGITGEAIYRSPSQLGGAGESSREDAVEESNEVPCSPPQDAHYSAGDGVEAASSGREWQTNSAPHPSASVAARVGIGTRSQSGEETGGVSDVLQTGYCGLGSEGGDRSGRGLALLTCQTSAGSEERDCLVEVRLDSIEVLEPGSDGTFGGLCPDGLVYNLEIAGYQTYIAQGLAVHNCHTAPGWLTSFCSVSLDKDEIHSLLGLNLPPINEGVAVWSEWAEHAQFTARAVVDASKTALEKSAALKGEDRKRLVKRILRLKDIERGLGELASAGKWKRGEGTRRETRMPGLHTDWVAEKFETRLERGVKFTPVWPHNYAEQYIYRGIPNVILTSGTMTKDIMQYMGIPPAKAEFTELDSSFDPKRHPTFIIPKVRVDRNNGEGEKRQLVSAIDHIIGARMDRKGLIHARSYDRAKDIIRLSKHSSIMMSHSAGGLATTVGRFKKSDVPSVLVSPSATEGIDLPHDDCRYVIIVKVPFVDGRSELVKARSASDRNYVNYEAALAMVQMAGRGMRAEDDQCEVFILDAHMEWFMERAKWPRWFMRTWKRVNTYPPPLKLEAL